MLVDSRHGLKDSDIEMMKILNDSRIAYQLVMTKTDLVKEKELVSKVKGVFEVMLTMRNNTCVPFIHAVSSVKNDGIEALKLNIAELLAQKWSTGDDWLQNP